MFLQGMRIIYGPALSSFGPTWCLCSPSGARAAKPWRAEWTQSWAVNNPHARQKHIITIIIYLIYSNDFLLLAFVQLLVCRCSCECSRHIYLCFPAIALLNPTSCRFKFIATIFSSLNIMVFVFDPNCCALEFDSDDWLIFICKVKVTTCSTW